MSATAVYDELVDSLGLAIVSGALAAGDRLTLSEIEERYGVSRTVARDAVKTLTGLGMVETRRRAGIAVLPRREWQVLSPEVIAWRLASDDRLAQIASLTDVREAIEPLAARLAAVHADAAQAEQLLALGASLVSMAERGLGRAAAYSDAMDEAFIARIAPALIGARLEGGALAERLRALEMENMELAGDIGTWLSGKSF